MEVSTCHMCIPAFLIFAFFGRRNQVFIECLGCPNQRCTFMNLGNNFWYVSDWLMWVLVTVPKQVIKISSTFVANKFNLCDSEWSLKNMLLLHSKQALRFWSLYEDNTSRYTVVSRDGCCRNSTSQGEMLYWIGVQPTLPKSEIDGISTMKVV